jgi:hypothetical protein
MKEKGRLSKGDLLYALLYFTTLYMKGGLRGDWGKKEDLIKVICWPYALFYFTTLFEKGGLRGDWGGGGQTPPSQESSSSL